MPGLNPGMIVESSTHPRSALAAALGLPDARAGAVAAAPGAAAGLAGKAAGAGGGLVAGGDIHDDRTVLRDAAGNGDGGIAGVDDGSFGDADRVAIGRIADALVGDDHHAPDAVVVGHRLRRAKRRKGSR